MKKVIVLAACLFMVSVVSNAQEVQKELPAGKEFHQKVKQKLTPEQRAQKNVEHLNAEVTLTEEQKTKVHGFALTRITKIDEIRAKYKGQPENKETAKTEIGVVRKEYRQNVKSILTPEQLTQLKAKHKEMKAAGKQTSLDQD